MYKKYHIYKGQGVGSRNVVKTPFGQMQYSRLITAKACVVSVVVTLILGLLSFLLGIATIFVLFISFFGIYHIFIQTLVKICLFCSESKLEAEKYLQEHPKLDAEIRFEDKFYLVFAKNKAHKNNTINKF